MRNDVNMKKQKKKKFKFDWEGGLSELKEKFTAVQLQHRISEIRIFKLKQRRCYAGFEGTERIKERGIS